MPEYSHPLSVRMKPRSLLLSADHYCRAVISDLFDDYGYPITCQSTLKDVVQHATTDRADLVIIDDDLGDMTAFEAVRIVRAALSAEGALKTILLSAGATRRKVETARKAGFDALIPKPIVPAPFLRTLKNLTWSRAA